MPDVQISQNDIESLAEKLAALASQLSEHERALLSFVLSVAADVISRSSAESPASPLVSRVSRQETPVVVKMEGPPPPIHDQFVNAFAPGAVADTASPIPGSVGGGP
jgi:hypothetical protein